MNPSCEPTPYGRTFTAAPVSSRAETVTLRAAFKVTGIIGARLAVPKGGIVAMNRNCCCHATHERALIGESLKHNVGGVKGGVGRPYCIRRVGFNITALVACQLFGQELNKPQLVDAG